ncbi:MAG: cytochrome c biogenesis protein ResB [Omnitrophica bacterium]|nr:cytochrome c biogenesis protein ResB [Candidatus Omnitrophota bacterium]
MKHKIINSPLFKFISSVKLFIFLCVIITLALVLGTVILQNAPPNHYLAKYGKATYELFKSFKLTDIYRAWWFIALLFLLAFNIFTCALKKFSLSLNRIGSTFIHFGIVIILAGAAVSAIGSERGLMGLREGESKDTFSIGHTQKKLGFKLYLKDFILEEENSFYRDKLIVEFQDRDITVDFPINLNKEYNIEDSSYQLKILRYIPDFSMDITTKEVFSKSDQPHNPAIEVEVVSPAGEGRQWVFAKFPGINMGNKASTNLKLTYVHQTLSTNIIDFKSKLVIFDNGEIVKTKTIEVNDPLQYKGYTFYQADYNPDDLTWTGIQVVKDPGVPLVYAGFCTFILGLLFTFYGKPFLNKKGR